jgi:hypothetical protein
MPLPPTLRQLLEDPIYRKMFTTPPRPSFCQTVAGARPWVVYRRTTGETAEGDAVTRWTGALCVDYPTAFRCARDALRALDGDELAYSDVALVSRSVLYGPPRGFQWFSYPGGHLMYWCGRCRRPSNFRYRPKHHALRNAPALVRDPAEAKRCYYCGMRWLGMPAYRSLRIEG